jgi:hypothetical protein
MGRVMTPDGKRVSIGLKVSEAKAEAVDAARGDMPRALWLEALVDAALAGGQASEAAPERRVRPPVRARAHTPGRTPPKRVREASDPAPDPVEAVRALAEASGVSLVPASDLKPNRCGHPGTRMVGGYCSKCDHLVAPGGLWREP